MRKNLSRIGAALAASLLSIPVWAGTISLAWNPVADSDLVGYRVYYGSAHASYSEQREIGIDPSATLVVADCQNWYVAVKARDASGNLSDAFSNEITGYPRPRLTVATPSFLEQGQRANLFLTGANFVPGATVRFTSSGITANSTTVLSCTTARVDVTIDDSAAIGSTSIELQNPDRSFGVAAGLLSIQPTTAPSVASTSPRMLEYHVPVSVHPIVAFSRPMLASTLTAANVRLSDSGGGNVPQAAGSPIVGADGMTATIVPADDLAFESTYRIVVVGGSDGVADVSGHVMPMTFLQIPGFSTVSTPTSLEITDVEVTPHATSAEIAWQTSVPADTQVFYRRHDQLVFQSTPVDPTPGTEHWAQITDLDPSTQYFFYVQSTDVSGTTVSSVSDGNFRTTAYVYLRLEAESGRLTLPVRTYTGQAFSGAWIATPAGSPYGTAAYPAGSSQLDFYVPEDGTWYVWVRLFGLDGTTNSWFASVDGSPRHTISPPATPGWYWSLDGGYALPPGEHTLELGGREAETRADRVIVTNDPDLVPFRDPGIDMTPPDPPTSVSAVRNGDDLDLSWRNAISDTVRVVVTYRTDGTFPATPADGVPVGGVASVPLVRSHLRHTPPAPGSYWYSFFALDAFGNPSDPARLRVSF